MAGNFPGTPAHPVKVQTELFSRVLRSVEYGVGISSHSGKVVLPHLERAAGEFIADTYIREQQIYPEQSRPMLQGEGADPSINAGQRFVVLRRHETEGWAELFATAANVSREGTYSARLPIEELFEDIFKDSAQTVGSVEISRLASRYPLDGAVQHAGFICLMRTSFALALEVGAPYIYAATEEFVLEAAGQYDLPMDVLGKPKRVQEARSDLTSLVPVRFNVNEINRRRSSYYPLIEYYLRDIEFHNGLGFFDRDLVAVSDQPVFEEPNYPEPLYPDL